MLENGILAKDLSADDNEEENLVFVYLENLQGHVEELKIKSNRMVVLTDTNWVGVYDLSAGGMTPQYQGSTAVSTGSRPELILNDSGDLAFVADYYGSYQYLDIQDPYDIEVGEPFQISDFGEHYKNILSNYPFFLISGNNLWFLVGQSLQLYETPDPFNEDLMIADSVTIPRFYVPAAMAASGSLLYEWVDDRVLVSKIDSSNPEEPFTWVDTIALPECVDDFKRNLSPSMPLTYLLFPVGSDRVAVMNERFIALIDFEGNGSCLDLSGKFGPYTGYLEYGTVFGDYLVIHNHGSSLYIFNLADPLNIQLEEPSLPNFTVDLFKVTNNIIAALGSDNSDEDEPLNIFDFTDGTLTLLASLRIPGDRNFHQNGRWFYSIDGSSFIPCYLTEFLEMICLNPLYNLNLGYEDVSARMGEFLLHNSYFPELPLTVWDFRDAGRPRPTDLRRYPREILEMLHVDDYLVFLTEQGYALMDYCGTDTPETLPFGWIDQPVQNQVVTDFTLQVDGWAIAAHGTSLNSVEIMIDADRFNVTDLSTGISRNDVAAIFSDYPDSPFSGFSGTIDLGDLPDGPHRLSILASEYGTVPYSFMGIIGIIDFFLDRDVEGGSSQIGIVDGDLEPSSMTRRYKVTSHGAR